MSGPQNFRERGNLFVREAGINSALYEVVKKPREIFWCAEVPACVQCGIHIAPRLTE
jgi:hypothetical protein